VPRWLFILLAVVAGWFPPANASAYARPHQADYDAGPSLEKVVVVAGITMDTYEGTQTDPLSLHKYLYCGANPVNRADPGGTDFGDLMMSMYVAGQTAAFNFMATSSSYAAAEAMVFVSAAAFADSVNEGNYVGAGVTLANAPVAGGVLFRLVRIFPGWASLGNLSQWVQTLAQEHNGATDAAMGNALNFSEQIVQGSIKVAGGGGAGADITCQAVVGGTTQVLKREVKVLNGQLSSLYNIITQKPSQLAGANVKQLFVQLGDTAMSSPDWKSKAIATARNAESHLGDIKVIIVDNQGNQIFP
jgi:hypothetical protein